VSTPEALFETVGRIAYLTFNRPDARNAMTWGMYDALAAACDRAEADPGTHLLVLRAAGEAFVAGTDIRQFTSFASAEDGLAYERRLDAVIDRLEAVEVPTIAQVQGVAAGGGCVIALVCDLLVCTPGATFGVPIARTLGNCLSSNNCARLVDLIGPARTKDLLFTGRFLDASEAHALGLVTRLAQPGEIDAVVRELAESILANAPLTLRSTKAAVARLARHRRPDPRGGDDLVARCYGSDDFREGVQSFLARRRPRFTGR
jgi:enoyl-CoA hydratase/carnithine racemase